MKLSFVLCCNLVSWLLTVIITATSANGPSAGDIDALVLSPNDPSALANTNMTLWCTLSNDFLQSYTADDLVIDAKKYPNHRLKSKSETTTEIKLVESFKKEKVNATTIRLFAENVLLEFDYHVMICHTKDWHLFNMQLIQVGEPPPQVIITEYCVLNWKSFVFKWIIPNHLGIRTTYTSRYKFHSNENNASNNSVGYVDCSKCISKWNTTARCNRCRIKNLNSSQRQITIEVTANSRYGSSSTSKTFPNLYSYNKPNRPHVSRNSSEAIDANGTYATTIVLQPPRRRVALYYYTIIQCESWLYEIESFQHADEDFTVQRAALPAYSECRVAVRCKSVDDEGNLSIYFSEESVEKFTTGEGVPRSPVETCSNCFYIEKIDESSTSCSLNRRDVVVLFKGLPENESRGKVTQYRVKYWKVNKTQDVSTSLVDVSSATSAELHLDVDYSYEVTIEASTSRGFNDTLVPNTILIPKQSDVMDPVVNLTALEINSTHVQLLWSPSVNDTSSRYTVFWCHSGKKSSSRCQSEIQWIELNHTTSSHLVQVMNGEDRPVIDSFGVSQFRFESIHLFTSNIVWTKCIFSSTHVSAPPTVRVFTAGEVLTLLLTTTQCPLLKSGYVYAYIIIVSELHKSNSEGDEFLHTTVRADDLHGDCFDIIGLRPSGNERGGCYLVTGLKPSTDYLVSVSAVTLAGVSNTAINFTTEAKPFLKTSVAIVVLVIGSVVASLLVGFGLCTLIRCCRKSHPLHVNIKVPNGPTTSGYDAAKRYQYSQCYTGEIPKGKHDDKPVTILPSLDSETVDYPDESGKSYSAYTSSSLENGASRSVGLLPEDLYARARLGNFVFFDSEPGPPRYDSGITDDSTNAYH